ncbi:MAG: MBL fold metallo-hydrolase [Spirochaetales bacterium]|jgi:7,8-dihydropterin-6-yl-methyl-4-(beta-D-ribofuranosyl)aminobenzene 5'-phosphate synthase|nr:MBL fold metallo-hydrolase [Spirochaetales bacterium]
MKVTLLLENNSLFNRFLNAEHGYSAWIEDEDIKVLYDTGYSDKYIKNAQELGIDLRQADYVIISHAHYDHCGGLKYLLKYYKDTAMARKPVLLVAHDDFFLKKFEFNWGKAVGFDIDRDILNTYFDVRVVREPLWLTKGLVYMGLTEISNDFEREFPQTAKKLKAGQWIDDFVIEDTQLAYCHRNGEEFSVVASCAHYGICNIISYAKKLTRASKIHTYIGGSHLRKEEVSEKQMEKTCEFLKTAQIRNFYICHDTDLPCKLRLANVTPILEAGVGLVVDCE